MLSPDLVAKSWSSKVTSNCCHVALQGAREAIELGRHGREMARNGVPGRRDTDESGEGSQRHELPDRGGATSPG